MTTRAIIVPEGRSSTQDQLNMADMLYLAELLGATVIELTKETSGHFDCDRTLCTEPIRCRWVSEWEDSE